MLQCRQGGEKTMLKLRAVKDARKKVTFIDSLVTLLHNLIDTQLDV